MTILMDDGQHPEPTKSAILAAYKKVVADSQPGDAIFLHYSGHGSKIEDDNNDEDDGYDEVLVPLDFQKEGMIRDDDLYDIFVKGLPQGVHVVSLVSFLWHGISVVCQETVESYKSSFLYQMDCCHSGTILDLPFVFQDDGDYQGLSPAMSLVEDFDWKKVLDGPLAEKVQSILGGIDLKDLAGNLGKIGIKL